MLYHYVELMEFGRRVLENIVGNILKVIEVYIGKNQFPYKIWELGKRLRALLKSLIIEKVIESYNNA